MTAIDPIGAPPKRYRVVQWATGNIGLRALRTVTRLRAADDRVLVDLVHDQLTLAAMGAGAELVSWTEVELRAQSGAPVEEIEQRLLEAERLQEALVCFQEILNVEPGNAEAHLKKGVVLERMNRLDLALSSYEEVLRLNPKRTLANVYKARVLAALHRYDEALSVYDSALGKKSPKGETPIFVS